MKLQDLIEMTMKVDKLSVNSELEITKTLEWMLSNSKHYGYIDKKAVNAVEENNVLTLAILNDNKLTSLVSGNFIELNKNKLFQLRLMYSLPEYRNLGDIVRLLYFVKHHLNFSIIGFGVQSPDGIKFFDSIYDKGKFKLSWINIKNGLKVDYSDNIDKRDNNLTDWRVLIESDNIPESFRLERWRADGLNMWYNIVNDEYEYWQQI